MQALVLIPASFLAGSILSLVLPLGVLLVITVWYVVALSRGMGER
jgi:hypothetical protein